MSSLFLEKEYDPEEAAAKIAEICSGSLRKAAQEGNVDTEGSVCVGQNVGLLRKEESVKDIMKSLTVNIDRIMNMCSQIVK